MISICLRDARLPGGRSILKVAPDSTVAQLREVVQSTLSSVSESGESFDILYGIPPVLLPHEGSALSLADVPIKNGCNLRVQKSEFVGVQAQGHDKVNDPAASKKRKQPSKNSGSSSSSSGGAKIATLSDLGGKGPAPPRRSSTSKGGGGKKKASGKGAGNETDIADHLLAAVSGDASSRGKTLRKVFRGAVDLQYKSSAAVARVAALEGQSFRFETPPSNHTTGVSTLNTLSSSLGGSSGSSMRLWKRIVHFPDQHTKSRAKDHVDEIDLIPKPLVIR